MSQLSKSLLKAFFILNGFISAEAKKMIKKVLIVINTYFNFTYKEGCACVMKTNFVINLASV